MKYFTKTEGLGQRRITKTLSEALYPQTMFLSAKRFAYGYTTMHRARSYYKLERKKTRMYERY